MTINSLEAYEREKQKILNEMLRDNWNMIVDDLENAKPGDHIICDGERWYKLDKIL